MPEFDDPMAALRAMREQNNEKPNALSKSKQGEKSVLMIRYAKSRTMLRPKRQRAVL